VNAALERLDRGHFGHCEGCWRMVSSRRLRAVPYARLCSKCAQTGRAHGRPTVGARCEL
jgi:RNA polymerase-binding transcription factor DksA